MELNQLRYFSKIVEKQSISKAANELFISQPALSIAIHNLENELGHYLFTRNKYGVELTEFGSKIYTDINEILNRISAIEDKAVQENSNVRIKIATTPSFTYNLLPITIQKFTSIFPDIPVTVEEKAIPRDESKLALSDYTFILTLINNNEKNTPGISRKNKYISHLLFTDKHVALLNNRHPLANSDSAITLEDLLNYPVCISGVMKQKCFSEISFKHQVILYSRESMKNYLAMDINSIGIIPRIFTLDDLYIDAEILTIKPLAIDLEPSLSGVYYDKSKPLSLPEQQFLKILLEESALLNKTLNN